MPKKRLDVLLVERGLAESRTKAQSLIMAGLVYSGEKKLDKAGAEIAEDTEIIVRGKEHPWVSRGGMKLAHALAYFALDVKGKVAIDVGASTGGFTDVLLAGGAAKVYAVDVGHGQLDVKLRNDPRVVVMENTNARHLTKESILSASTASKVLEEAGASNTLPACGERRRGERATFGKGFDSTRHRTSMNRAEDLRKNPTDAEKRLWQCLRASQLCGVKFRRQQSIGHYIVDFVAMSKKLVVELDGGQHAEEKKQHDINRTNYLNGLGYNVLRYWNHDIFENIEGVLEDISAHLTAKQAFPSPNLSPRAGRGIRLAAVDAASKPMSGILDLIVCDASFISLKKVLPAAMALAKPSAQMIALIKPQFEVGKKEASKGEGVIRDPALHAEVCNDIHQWMEQEGWAVQGIAESPITGPAGNKEFLLHAVK